MTVAQINAEACTSGIGKVNNPITLFRLIAQLINERSRTSYDPYLFFALPDHSLLRALRKGSSKINPVTIVVGDDDWAINVSDGTFQRMNLSGRNGFTQLFEMAGTPVVGQAIEVLFYNGGAALSMDIIGVTINSGLGPFPFAIGSGYYRGVFINDGLAWHLTEWAIYNPATAWQIYRSNSGTGDPTTNPGSWAGPYSPDGDGLGGADWLDIPLTKYYIARYQTSLGWSTWSNKLDPDVSSALLLENGDWQILLENGYNLLLEK